MAKGKEVKKLVITRELRNFIKDEEAIIVSAPLLRTLIWAAVNKHNRKKYQYALAWDNLKNHYIYATTSYEFAVLIPKSKYADIEKTETEYIYYDKNGNEKTAYIEGINLEKIGLNKNMLTIMHIGRGAAYFLKKFSSQKSRDKINIDTLKEIFRSPTAREINKRVYLTRHGSKKP